MSEITDFNWTCNSKIWRVWNYWLKKHFWTGLNQFVHTCQKLLIDEKGVVKQNYNFLWILAKLKKEKEKFLPLTSIGQKLVTSPFQSEISDIPAGCSRMKDRELCTKWQCQNCSREQRSFECTGKATKTLWYFITEITPYIMKHGDTE